MRTLVKAALAAAAAVPLMVAAAHAQVQLPAGSYAQTCTNAHYMGAERLVADCPDRVGNFTRTAIDWQTCQGDIYNVDGRLDCRRVAAIVPGSVIEYRDRPPSGPSATYPNNYPTVYPAVPSAITLHSRPGYDGSVATFDGPVADLREIGFSGYAESLVVSGASTWQLCSEPGYRGRCVVVSGNVGSLAQAGLAGPVWSIRPLN